MAVKPKKACPCQSSYRLGTVAAAYSKGLVQVLAVGNSLGLHHAVLDKVMDVLQSSVEERLGNLLVFLGS